MDNGLQLLLAAGAVILIILIIRNRSSEPYAPLEEAPVTYAPAGQPAPRIINPEETKGALLKASLGQPTSCSASANMLPKPPADDGFGQFAPDPRELAGQNFIDASRWVTLGAMSTKRNISRDIRSEIPIPKNNAVSPWNQSSIDQQVEGRPLDCPVDLK